MTTSQTHNAGVQYEHTMNHAIEFFSKAGSQFKNKKSYYGSEATALTLFKAVWYAGDYELAMRLLFWLRDPRGGAGNRSGFRECLAWISAEAPAWIIANAHLIPEHGRWDDARATFGTKAQDSVVSLWADKIAENNFLASKWAKRKDKEILRKLRQKKVVKDIGDFRRLLASIRKTVVERNMCQDLWNEISYDKLPSVAMARYTNAFGKHDTERFEAYKNALEKGVEDVKINASVLFPHDVLRTLKHGDSIIADAQFEALPNFMEDTNMRILPIADQSGSMTIRVSGNITAMEVAASLAFYCSDRLGKDNPFYKKFMEFSDEGNLIDWSKYDKLSDAVNARLFSGLIGLTAIHKALNTILHYAKLFNATNEQIPNCLLIISDMQFNSGAGGSYDYYGNGCHEGTDQTEVNRCLNAWEKEGYSRPKVIYWNTSAYGGSPEKATSKDIGLVSGFSPAILKSIFGGTDFSPIGIMTRAIEKYKIVSPS